MSIQYSEAILVTRCMCEGNYLQVTTTGESEQLCCKFLSVHNQLDEDTRVTWLGPFCPVIVMQ